MQRCIPWGASPSLSKIAISLCTQALTLQCGVADRRSAAQTLTTLGEVYAACGQIHRALRLLKESLVLSRAINDRHAEAEAAWILGGLVVQRGEFDAALKLLQIRLNFDRVISHRDLDRHQAYILDIQHAFGSALAEAETQD